MNRYRLTTFRGAWVLGASFALAGFASAQPPEGVFMFGGPGGPPGGPGEGGPRRFDPTEFIRRLDSNGNGAIDPEEQQGPAQFMLRRMAERNPELDLSKPIPISRLGEMMANGRGGRGGFFGGGEGGEFGEPDDPSMVVPESLVPGFGVPDAAPPPTGFGVKGGLFAVRVAPEDLKEAQERIRQFDRNRNGMLDGDEFAGRWSGKPLDFDRNGDGKLSENELAVRAARRRAGRTDAERQKAAAERKSSSDGTETKAEAEEDRMQGRRSYRHAERAVPEGLPDWFKSSDTNSDGQVDMKEYTGDWTDAKLSEFLAFDANTDGLITEREAAGLDKALVTSAPSSGSSGQRKREVKRSGTLKPAYMKWAERTIKRADKDGDGALSKEEAGRLDVDPSAADHNDDGRITIEEYAWLSQISAESKR